ncbi:MAG: enoyl-CoA hydratase-related protein [Thermodesulfobacteriota bacterium]|nr:enoyl-CoA hydratase-related protein [Thermodesulfobacteriota bacterium]
MTADKVVLERRGPVALITLNSPETSNSMDLELGGAMFRVLEAAARDQAVRSVVLTGQGRTFSAGANIKAMRYEVTKNPNLTPSQVLKGFIEVFNRAAVLIFEMDKPVVAAVNGTAAGGGMALALACDIILASSSARFDPAYVRMGLVPVGGMSAIIPQLAGRKLATEFLFLARPIDAAEARAMGLINRVTVPDEVLPEAMKLAQVLAEKPRQSIARTKKLLNQADASDLAGQMAREEVHLRACADTPEHRAIVEAFVKKDLTK